MTQDKIYLAHGLIAFDRSRKLLKTNNVANRGHNGVYKVMIILHKAVAPNLQHFGKESRCDFS
jgi:hypothetical protein